jgi:deoxyribonuclease V
LPKLPSNFSVKKAHDTQTCLSKRVILEDRLPKQIRTVGGVDVSYVGDLAIGAVVVLDYETLELHQTAVAACPVNMPYVPTLLSFRELPSALAAIKQLKLQPDVFLVDAQGYAHPCRCGFASHLGLAIGKPTIGAAKSRLIGERTDMEGRTVLLDKGEVIGEVVTIEEGCEPVYVSIGHMVSLETAVQIIRHCSKSRIPEPLLHAHKLATKTRLEQCEGKVNIPKSSTIA